MTKQEEPNTGSQLVPETVLKRRHDLDEVKAKSAAVVKGNNKVFSNTRKIYVKKPETYLAKGTSRKHHDIRFKRVMKKGMQKRASKKKVVEVKTIENAQGEEHTVEYQANSVGAPMVFVVRIRDNSGIAKRVFTCLRKLRLTEVYNGVFLKYTEENRKLLHLVEPWVIYGPPSNGMVSDLINRRGHGRVKKMRTPLSDNTIIERSLGHRCGIICVEDLVHEICSAGDNFDAATEFIWPFRLSAPKTQFEKRKLNDKEGKVYGDRGEDIDTLVKLML